MSKIRARDAGRCSKRSTRACPRRSSRFPSCGDLHRDRMNPSARKCSPRCGINSADTRSRENKEVVLMPSPFPGMDPYLESHLWPDLHHRLATQISDQLVPLIQPRYVARIVVRTVLEELETREAVRVIMPDVELFTDRVPRTQPILHNE